MPLKVYRRKGSLIWSYRGTLAGDRKRGTTGSSDKETATRIASEIENKFWKRGLDSKEKALTWPKAVALYMAAGKSPRFLLKLSEYWRDATYRAIRKRTIKRHPKVSEAIRRPLKIVKG